MEPLEVRRLLTIILQERFYFHIQGHSQQLHFSPITAYSKNFRVKEKFQK